MTHCPACEKAVDGGARFCPFCGAQMVVVQAAGDDPYLGRLVGGKYLVESVIGEGGMGRVYKAVQQPLEKTVVLKVLHAALQTDASLVARFQREARAASRLSHPNCIQVTDFGQMDDGALFIAMEYLEGRDLAAEMAGAGPFSEERLVHVVCQILAALVEAHESGVIHRDLKPENVMLVPRRDDPDHVKVLDFGIAKLQDAREGPDAVALTQAGLVCGTPEYMSPEQARDEPLDARSDIYAIGVLMYQLVTGELPFKADSSIGIVTKHLTEPPPPPRDLAPSLSEELEAVILRCMAKEKDARPSSAEALRAELAALGAKPKSGTIPSFAAAAGHASAVSPRAEPSPNPSHSPSVSDEAQDPGSLRVGVNESSQEPGAAGTAPLPNAAPGGGPAPQEAESPATGSEQQPSPSSPQMAWDSAAVASELEGMPHEAPVGAHGAHSGASPPKKVGALVMVVALAIVFMVPAGAAVGYLAWSGMLADMFGSEGESTDATASGAEAQERDGEAAEVPSDGSGSSHSMDQAGLPELASEAADTVTRPDPTHEASPADVRDVEPTGTAEPADSPVVEGGADLETTAASETEEGDDGEDPERLARDSASATPETGSSKTATPSSRGISSPRERPTAQRTERPSAGRTTDSGASSRERADASRSSRRAPVGEGASRPTARGTGGDPARARILATTADQYFERGDYGRALNLYQQAARQDPTEPTYQRQIGLTNIELGRGSNAVAPLRRYLQMAPDAPDRARIQALLRRHGG